MDCIMEMIIHFGFHHFLNRPAKQILKRILDVLGGFDVILLKKLMDDVAFSFGHYYFVYWFLFSYHNKRPPMIFILSFIIEDLSNRYLQKNFDILLSCFRIQ
jgi:hypothetical protein